MTGKLGISSFGRTHLFAAALAVGSWRDLAGQIWYRLNRKYTVGNAEVSVTTLIGGVLIFAVAVLLSRTLSALLERRIAKRAYLDPGIRYTIGRLTQYVIISIGDDPVRYHLHRRLMGAGLR